MKKVGIITTFRQPNWGSVLQAYALQKAIENLGFNAELIDYIYPNEFHWQRGLLWGQKKTSFKDLVKSIKAKFLCNLGIKAHDLGYLANEFINRNVKVSKRICTHSELHKLPPSYDIYVSGSDQIWNPNTMKGDMSYFLDFAPLGTHKIAYASSFSCKSIPAEYRQMYVEYLSQYKAISVRENNGKAVVSELLGIEVPVTLDPTLLLNKDEWNVLADKAKKVKLPEKYILCYMLAYTFDVSTPMCELLSNVQEKYKFPVIALKGLPKGYAGDVYSLPRNYDIGIAEFLNLIRNAEIVVSSSFHGTAFSLNFGKPLFALAANNDDDRVASILNEIGLDNLLVYSDNIQIDNVNPYYYDLEEQTKLELLRNESKEYLRIALL